MAGESILGMPGCGACAATKKITKGKVKVISVGTKKGMAIAQKLRPDKYPFCFKKNKKGKIVKCNTKKFLKKYGIILKSK